MKKVFLVLILLCLTISLAVSAVNNDLTYTGFAYSYKNYDVKEIENGKIAVLIEAEDPRIRIVFSEYAEEYLKSKNLDIVFYSDLEFSDSISFDKSMDILKSRILQDNINYLLELEILTSQNAFGAIRETLARAELLSMKNGNEVLTIIASSEGNPYIPETLNSTIRPSIKALAEVFFDEFSKYFD